jgi:hypothetical protein
MEAREVVADDMATATLAASYAQVTRSCPGINLPVGGVLSMPNGEIVTLTAAAAFKPLCTPVSPPAIIANGGGGSVTIDDDIPEGSMPTENGWTYSDFRDPFYASTFPQCYALAATTVVAYMLVIMLFVTPRSFLDGGVVVLGRRGFTNGGTGLTIGGRPWLQKVAALAVAISPSRPPSSSTPSACRTPKSSRWKSSAALSLRSSASSPTRSSGWLRPRP